MNTFLKCAAIAGVACAGLVSVDGTAQASNTKFYPGIMCQAQPGSTILHDVNGPSYNWTSQDAATVCPIVRDEVRADGNGWASLVVTTLNTSASEYLSCKATTYNPNDYGYASISIVSQAPRTDWTDRSFGTIPVPTNGYIIFTCTLPAVNTWPSGIASYRIDE